MKAWPGMRRTMLVATCLKPSDAYFIWVQGKVGRVR